jgi:hypothetical protein
MVALCLTLVFASVAHPQEPPSSPKCILESEGLGGALMGFVRPHDAQAVDRAENELERHNLLHG